MLKGYCVKHAQTGKRSGRQANSCYIPSNQSCTLLVVTLHFSALPGMQGLRPSNQTCGHEAPDEVA